MRLLAHLASLAEKHVPELAAYHPQKVVQQFVKSLQNELNFMTEGHNADQVAANFEGHRRRSSFPKSIGNGRGNGSMSSNLSMESPEWTFEQSMRPEWTANALPKPGPARCSK